MKYLIHYIHNLLSLYFLLRQGRRSRGLRGAKLCVCPTTCFGNNLEKAEFLAWKPKFISQSRFLRVYLKPNYLFFIFACQLYKLILPFHFPSSPEACPLPSLHPPLFSSLLKLAPPPHRPPRKTPPTHTHLQDSSISFCPNPPMPAMGPYFRSTLRL